MKRYGDLWNQVIDFSNLVKAAKKAQKGKRFQQNVLAFNHNLESELIQLQTELEAKRYCPGPYRTFVIQESKRRLISAAPYRDRVIHHALCNVITPIFESTLISDTYANRIGFGTHKALDRFTQFARSSRYVLQCDICKYFPSIDHEILKLLIRRKIKCPDTLWLIDKIINNSNEQEAIFEYFPNDDLLTPFQRRHGLPIGNLTSQFFANFYLSGLDHFIKETLKIRKYLRYVDDFALFSDDWQLLTDSRQAIEEYLTTLRLKIHPIKSQLFETKHGANFLGFRIFPTYIRVRTDNLRRARKRLRKLQNSYAIGHVADADVHHTLQSWIAHLSYGNTWQLRQQIFSSLVFARS
jgi:retron-type reverse transcriptase